MAPQVGVNTGRTLHSMRLGKYAVRRQTTHGYPRKTQASPSLFPILLPPHLPPPHTELAGVAILATTRPHFSSPYDYQNILFKTWKDTPLRKSGFYSGSVTLDKTSVLKASVYGAINCEDLGR